ncbi:MAG: uroporphyrinogen-III C-methyltransferase [Rhodocyclaceae bacterium]|nr:uroporphyrinogen-III C-methyltransferase [Rhodocyclaceae bacterium]
MPGKVYLVGAGPGAADLLTLRAARLLDAADVVLYDALVAAETLTLARRAELLPVGKRAGLRSTAQQLINQHLIEAAQKHSLVVRLKGGDPMMFGRAQEEIAALDAAGIAWEVVPGVTAALGASAALGISLTRRGIARSVCFVTPRIGPEERDSEWLKAAIASDTAVLYMAGDQATQVCAALAAAGMPLARPAALVVSAATADQQVFFTTLEGLPDTIRRRHSGPALVLLGEVYGDALAAALQGADVPGAANPAQPG